MKEVAMKVNQENLVKGLKYSFTNKTTVLGELMQNARRAGASKVVFDFNPEKKELRISDDGCGIDSIETLLTVAGSGWDANMAAEEHPFGIGFLSALFACRHLTVSSKGGCLSAATEDVLSFKSVSVTKISDWDGNTEIILHEIGLDEKHISHTLETLARGFPIPVIYNDEVLKRPLSINSELQFEETEIGLIHLNVIDSRSANHRDYEIFLQGLPVYRSRTYFHGDDEHHVIHLDSSSFYARLPDRDKLIDQDEVLERIKNILEKEIKKRLVSMKSILSAEAFIKYYYFMRDWSLLSLLNDVPLVPIQALGEITDSPVLDTDAFGSFISDINEPVSRDEVEKRGVVSINDDLLNEGSARYLFAWTRNNYIYHGHLDKGHWLNTLVQYLDSEKVKIEIINESHRSSFKGNWAWLEVCFCDGYKIHIGNDVVEISDETFYTGQENDDLAIVPQASDSSDALRQACSFRNEYDEFQQSAWDNDSDAFTSFIVANTTRDATDAIKQLLPNFTGCPLLYGETFVLNLDKEGKVASVTAA